MRIRGVSRAVALLAVVVMAVTGAVPAAAAPATRGYLFDGADTSIVAFDPATNTITNRIPVGVNGQSLAVRPDGREIYVADQSGDAVVVVSTVTNAVVARIPVDFPRHTVFTLDSRFAYVTSIAGNGNLVVIDTGTRRVVRRIPMNASWLDRPAISPDGLRIYVGADPTSGNTRTVNVISTATNTLTKRIPLAPGGPAPTVVAFAPNGMIAVLTTGDVIDTRTETIVRRIGIEVGSADDLVFTADSARLFVASRCRPVLTGSVRVFDVASGQQIGTVVNDGHPNSLALTPDGRQLYAVLNWGGGVAVVDVATSTIVDTFGVAAAPHVPRLSDINLSSTAPAVGRGDRFAPQPRQGEPCFP